MRKFNKIISCVIALSMLISMFSMISVSAATLDELTLTYTFANDAKGVADGTVTIAGIDADLQAAITNVNIYWGKSSTEALDGYYNLKYYTVLGYYKEDGTTKDAVAANAKTTKLAYTDDALVYEMTGNMAIPSGATHLIADVVTADATKQLCVEIPAEKRLNLTTDSLKYAMIWASDIHLKKSSALAGSTARTGIQGAVAVSELYGDKFKGMILNGDIADTAKDYEYSMAEQFFEDYGVDFPIYYANGNHDTIMFSNGVSKYDECEKAMQYRFDKLEEDFGITFGSGDFWSYETTIGGHHYIFFASPYLDKGIVYDSRKDWLEEKISMYEKSGEPTFVFTHYPYSGKLSKDTAGFTFDEILERHPSVTVITSHVHMELNSDFITTSISTDGGHNFIDTASMSYTNNPNGSTRYDAEGRFIEVYDDVIILKARDYTNNKWIPRGEHILNVNGTENPFEGTFSITSSAAEGTIEVGTELTAKLNGADIPDGYTVTWYDMLGTELGTGASYTVATANASVSAKIVKAEDNSYAYSVARYIAPVEDDGEGDTDSGDSTPSIEFTNDTTVKYYGEVVNISGNAGVDYAGQNATIVLVPGATYDDISTAKYVGECTIDAEGYYNFKFKADNVSANDVFLVKVGANTVSANVVVARTNEELVEVTPSLDDANILSLSIKNVLADTTSAKLIIATYDVNDKLIKVTPVDYNMAFNENLGLQSYAGDTALTGTYAKIYMWTNLSDLVPLSNGDREEIPTLSSVTEEVTE